MNNEITLDVTGNGEIRFKRGDKEYNQSMIEILSQIAPERVSELEKFFNEGNEIELLMGDVIFCG